MKLQVKSMSKWAIETALSASLALAASTVYALPRVLVEENFGAGALNGQTADTFSPAITSAGGSGTWAAGATFAADGVVTAADGNSGAYLNLGSYINSAKGTADGKFELTMTISPTTGAWIALGFTTQNTPSITKNFTSTGSGVATTGVATIIRRSTTGTTANRLDGYAGPNNTNSSTGTAQTGSRTLTVALDFTPLGGYNGTTNFGRVTFSDSVAGSIGSFTYTTNNAFGAIFISEADVTSGTESGGTISALSLSQAADTIPPTLAGTGFVDDKSGGPVVVAEPVTYTVTFSEPMNASTVEVADFANGGTAVVTVDSVTATANPAVFTVVATPTTTGTLQLQVKSGAVLNDVAGLTLATAAPIPDNTSINVNSASGDINPPLLASTTPADNATNVLTSANLVATFNEPIQAGTGNLMLRKTIGDVVVESFSVSSSSQLNFSGSAVMIDPTIDLEPGVEYYVLIDATAIQDTSLNSFAGISSTTGWSFTTDGTPPALASTTPADNATNVLTSANLVATFNEPIQAGTGNLTLMKTIGDVVVESFDVTSSPQLSFSGATVTINPTSDLEPGTEYYVLVGATAIKDSSLNSFAGISSGTAWSFTTDGTPPALMSTIPADDATKVVVGTKLTLVFNENVQANLGNVTINLASDNSVVETIDVNTPGAVVLSGSTVTIIRSVPLDLSTAYYVKIDAGAFHDLSGNAFAGIASTTAWSFTSWDVVPIVAEYFGGTGSAGLNGTSADTFAAAIATAGGSATWTAGSSFRNSGTVTVDTANTGASLNLGSYINAAKGTANGKFDLTMTISETAGSWVSLGFTSQNSPAVNKNFTDVGLGVPGSTLGIATIIRRSTTSIGNANRIDAYAGPTNTNPITGTAQTGSRTLTVSLDLTPGGGYNGSTNFGTVTFADSVAGTVGSFTYTTNPAFGAIFLSEENSSGGTISNLYLTQTIDTSTYGSWQTANGTSQTIGEDHDSDGVANGIEYFTGGPTANTTGFTPLPGVNHTAGVLSVIWNKASTYAGSYGTDYVIETSETLAGPWNVEAAAPAAGATVTFPSPTAVKFTFPAGGPAKKFARLKVTGP